MEEKKYSVEITVRDNEFPFLKMCELGLAGKLVVDTASYREVKNGVSVLLRYDEPCYLFWLGYILRARVDNREDSCVNN